MIAIRFYHRVICVHGLREITYPVALVNVETNENVVLNMVTSYNLARTWTDVDQVIEYVEYRIKFEDINTVNTMLLQGLYDKNNSTFRYVMKDEDGIEYRVIDV